jgi:hypothetical protein
LKCSSGLTSVITLSFSTSKGGNPLSFTEAVMQVGGVAAPAHLLERGFGGDAHFLAKAHDGAFRGAAQPVHYFGAGYDFVVVIKVCAFGGIFCD